MLGEALVQLGAGWKTKETNKLTAACKKQLAGTCWVKLTRDDKNQLKPCLPVYVSDTASSMMTTDYTGKSQVCTSWEQSCWDCRHAVHI